MVDEGVQTYPWLLVMRMMRKEVIPMGFVDLDKLKDKA